MYGWMKESNDRGWRGGGVAWQIYKRTEGGKGGREIRDQRQSFTPHTSHTGTNYLTTRAFTHTTTHRAWTHTLTGLPGTGTGTGTLELERGLGQGGLAISLDSYGGGWDEMRWSGGMRLRRGEREKVRSWAAVAMACVPGLGSGMGWDENGGCGGGVRWQAK
ncbi:hypothetical protein CORC01_07132 [Colletotrichum orchidophilum]|uniref:Uncharacterized protein n=1 Tax=Colletotrichum orchidophilum TaxID=1209926 RepID=A0A1G4B7X5_9PEZI|nr:uncharacterized protein CORC01_07132 [Colletotrichum orchidophilum]OHE97517.1 hypothetical protein CORC01_07132 [Colletotrichum orchidophilum]